MKNLVRVVLACFLLVINLPAYAVIDADSVSGKYINWFNKDPNIDHVAGVSAEKAYSELLKNKTSHTVIVAVIDGGVDVNHEDLQGNVWVNEAEIPGNGIDDDNNGYIDDIHGWNFLGNSEGENIEFETYELTRLYKLYNDRFEGKSVDEIPAADKDDYDSYLEIRKTYLAELKEAKEERQMLESFDKNFRMIDNFMISYLNPDYTIQQVKAIDSEDEQVNAFKDALLSLYESGFSKENYEEYKEYIDQKVQYHLNPDYNPRGIIGDDPEDFSDASYGNNDVKGADAAHGTHVAGIIAAERDNAIGINGIATNVKIMAIRAVPNGDERDKDVANAIKYAVDNGAHIINMSFGKDYSPQKEAVDQAIRMAEEKGVLMVHAAGNDASDNDEIRNYPVDDVPGKKIRNWITVGATNLTSDVDFVADFSNYGRRTVDIFAPGEDIYSLKPENGYTTSSGTSMASPVVSGVAAMIMSYYPDLSSRDVKKILLKSASEYKKLKVYLPSEGEGEPEKVKFKKLSVSGGVVNAYEAIKMAEKKSKR